MLSVKTYHCFDRYYDLCGSTKKSAGLDPGALTLQEGVVVLREATRSSIQFCTSSDNHATLQAPSLIRCGNWPAASRRAICWKLYGTP